MKKAFLVMMAFVIGMTVTSCKQGQKSGTTPEEAAANPVETLNQLVDKAKAEGANWSVDEWKEAYRTAFYAMSPAMKGMYEIMQLMKGTTDESVDTVAIAKAMTKAKEIEVKFGQVASIVERFDSIGNLYPNGKSVSEDKDFEKQLLKEVGLPENLDL